MTPDDIPAVDPRLVAARAKEALLELHLYCNNSDCCVREVVVATKDYAQDLIDPVLMADGFGCPLCAERLALHHVLTSRERADQEESVARRSVNAQMWRRDHPGDLLQPLSRASDRLPPTPEGWWDRRDGR